MSTEWQQLSEMIKQLNPKTYVRWIKRRPQLMDWVMQQRNLLGTEHIVDTLYCLEHQITPIKCPCGRNALFNTFVKGYRQFCSNSCPSKGQVHGKAIEKVWQDQDKLQQMISRRADTNLKKYGHTNPAKNPIIQEKIRNTVQERYGGPTPFESPAIVNKIRGKSIEKYGVEFPFQNEQIRQQAASTFVEKHGKNQMQFARAAWQKQNGAVNPFEIPEIKQRSQQTMMDRYGVKYAFQLPEFYAKHANTVFERYGRANTSQRHLSDEQYALLTDRDSLETMLKIHSLSHLSELSGISRTLIMNWHDRHALDIIKPSKRSFLEDEIAQFLDELGVVYQRNCHRTIAPLELDFVIPSHQMAIEFNGLYWHSEVSGCKDRKYHVNKMQQCGNQGLKLLTIWEDEWIKNNEICKSVISSYCGKSQKIAARACDIVTLTTAQEKEFFTTNHLQGYIGSSFNVGLKYGEQIVACMSFAKSRFNRNVEWELMRNATAKNFVVVGGASKMFKHFLKKCNPASIVSYCDRRWFTGEIYSRLGFIRKSVNPPTYWYTDYKSRFHRFQFQKHKIKHLVENGAELTEWQIQQQMGYDRVWDCGQDTWIWTR